MSTQLFRNVLAVTLFLAVLGLPGDTPVQAQHLPERFIGATPRLVR
jgi:hypothetical protein